MPIYDYSCSGENCPEPEFESLQKIGADEIDCPSCGSKATRHEVAQLRLGDWYANSSSLRFHFNWTEN